MQNTNLESKPRSSITGQETASIISKDNQADIPRSVLDPFSVLNAISSIQLTSLKLSLPECKDEGFLVLVEFLKRPSSRQYCVKLQSYSIDLGNLCLPLNNNKVEGVFNFLKTVKHDFKQALKLDAVGKERSTSLCDGLESYLLALSYDDILTRHLGSEIRQDLQLSRKIMLLNADGKLLESIGMTLSPQYLQSLCISIILFENATTPISKLSHLADFLKTITAYLTYNDFATDTDHFLLAIIVFLLKCPPSRLITSLNFTKIRGIEGKEAFVIVTLEAAIDYIFSYELSGPTDVIAAATRSTGRKEKKNGDVVHDSTMVEVQKTAHGFASKFFESTPPLAIGNEAVKDRLMKTVNKNT